ncbi:MAG: hypothetical protein C3F11_14280 [Methylocystaceae bacterium]|nr:MAG: hypothetical protein C3F11_14280 [Methylocystaceae bacterium]
MPAASKSSLKTSGDAAGQKAIGATEEDAVPSADLSISPAAPVTGFLASSTSGGQSSASNGGFVSKLVQDAAPAALGNAALQEKLGSPTLASASPSFAEIKAKLANSGAVSDAGPTQSGQSSDRSAVVGGSEKGQASAPIQIDSSASKIPSDATSPFVYRDAAAADPFSDASQKMAASGLDQSSFGVWADLLDVYRPSGQATLGADPASNSSASQLAASSLAQSPTAPSL